RASRALEGPSGRGIETWWRGRAAAPGAYAGGDIPYDRTRQPFWYEKRLRRPTSVRLLDQRRGSRAVLESGVTLCIGGGITLHPDVRRFRAAHHQEFVAFRAPGAVERDIGAIGEFE